MARLLKITWKRVLAAAVAFAILGAAGSLLFGWSGLYSVAASRGHWFFVEWFLTFVMQNSVERHALLVDEPPAFDRDHIILGAGHYHSGCAWCHGAPGVPTNPVARSMLPPPPELAGAIHDWREQELFWIVKHGIKYTGMPSWASQERDDEVWAVVAFLDRMSELDAAGYRELALGGVDAEAESGREVATEEARPAASSACARCHGAGRSGPRSALVPVIHGQPMDFLVAALEAYAMGARESGIMQPIAGDLTPEALHLVAEYYARLPPLTAARESAESANEIGRTIAEQGLPEAEIPACLSCHSNSALEAYPRLAGQSARYIASQLRLWQTEVTRHTETAAIMTPIAQRLTDEQIDAVARYFERLPAGQPEARQ